MRLILQVVLVVVVVCGIALDPNAWNPTGTDLATGALNWHMLVALLSMGILVMGARYLIRARNILASKAFLAETLLSLLISAALVQQDGFRRFTHGIGAEQDLSYYLLLVACRVVLLFSVMSTNDAA